MSAPRDPAHRAAHESRLAAASGRRAEQLSWLRVAIFLLGFLVAVVGLAATDEGAPVFAGGLVVAALLFTGVARAQRAAIRRREWHRAIASVCTEVGHRRARDWAELPVTAAPSVPADHPYAADLGVVGGRASLLQLLGPLGTATGARTAARWLLAPAPPSAIRARQVAVAELAGYAPGAGADGGAGGDAGGDAGGEAGGGVDAGGATFIGAGSAARVGPNAPFTDHADFRLELAARARLASSSRTGDVGLFLEWASAEPWLGRRPILAATRWLLPALWATVAIAVWLDLVPGTAFVIPLLSGIAVAGAGGLAATRLLGRAAPGAATFRVFSDQFERIVREPCEAPLLRTLQAALIDDGVPAAVELRRLRRLLDAAELRFSPMLHGMVNVVTAWDLHVLHGLEGWQRRVGSRVAGWFGALGEVEVLGAFASLLADNSDWSLPELAEGALALDARALGHPLLPPDRCVRNDVAVGPPGSFLLVTGSNMAGKSTLLRALGANAVLALAGAPVCAAHLRLPPLSIRTSMRVGDDLEAGLSFFMAELVRLSGVVEAARAAAAQAGSPRVLYLLDEILQGTNSAERQVAARRVLEHLLEAGAVGAVSTHDLGLADTPHLQAAARAVHFREQLVATAEGPRMDFDYRLRPGPATSANALKLVELMGL